MLASLSYPYPLRPSHAGWLPAARHISCGTASRYELSG